MSTFPISKRAKQSEWPFPERDEKGQVVFYGSEPFWLVTAGEGSLTEKKHIVIYGSCHSKAIASIIDAFPELKFVCPTIAKLLNATLVLAEATESEVFHSCGYDEYVF